MSQKVLLITPPFTQLNTPYPATAYLKGYLNTINVDSMQCDLGIEVILELFSKDYLAKLFAEIEEIDAEWSDNSTRILKLKADYLRTIDSVIAFLQGQNGTLAHVICDGNYLPQASRFAQAEDLDWAFGLMGIRDKAKHLATLYLEDLSDLIVETIDPHFGFSRYAERLGRSADTFDEMNESLQVENSFIDEITLKLFQEKIESYQPSLVGLSVPFPGNLYSAFKCGQWLKEFHPEIKIAMGGGFPNTELRSLTDPRVFEFVDFITLDDGEAPLQNLLEHLDGERDVQNLKRTFVCQNGEVVYCNESTTNDVPQAKVGTPDYSDFALNRYLSVIEIANPMHRLWSDGRWNKMTLAHGCYWGRCTFCDTSLDYIKRFEPNTVQHLCDRIEKVIAETGEIGFHFVDEAAPPALMRALALEIIRRKITIVWWTNIRFEKNFTADLCYLLKESGCIAVSGGLEVASERLLGMINKGVSLTKVAQITDNFTRAGIMVHAYLMYGFPTQTVQETIDSLEVVRQLFEAGVVQSGFWHRFAMTAHSPIGLNPDRFKVSIENKKSGSFANNDRIHTDPKGANHELFGDGLRKSLFNYMHGICFDFPLQRWFDFKVPKTTVAPTFIQSAIERPALESLSPNSKVYWIGGAVSVRYLEKKKKNRTFEMAEVTVFNKQQNLVISVNQHEGKWLEKQLQALSLTSNSQHTYGELNASFEADTDSDFVLFWNSKPINKLRENGLVVL